MAVKSTISGLIEYNGTLLAVNGGSILSANVLNSGSTGHSLTFIDDDGVLRSGANSNTQVMVNGGADKYRLTYVGTGTVYLLGFLGVRLDERPLTIFSVNGKTYLYAPKGMPILSGLAFSYSVSPTNFTLPNQSPICFADGTRVATDRGMLAVEILRPGMLVATLDHGWQPLRWIGGHVVSRTDQRDNPAARAVLVARGALGRGLPLRDLVLTQQHRVLTSHGTGEALVAVKHLLGQPGISLAAANRNRAYLHLLFDDHEILSTEGLATESLYPGARLDGLLSASDRAEIAALRPNGTAGAPPRLARPVQTGGALRRSGVHLTGVGFMPQPAPRPSAGHARRIATAALRLVLPPLSRHSPASHPSANPPPAD